jgi:hypothetical protein
MQIITSHGMARNSMACKGKEMERNGMAWNGKVWHGKAWYDMEIKGNTRHVMERQGLTWRGMI